MLAIPIQKQDISEKILETLDRIADVTDKSYREESESKKLELEKSDIQKKQEILDQKINLGLFSKSEIQNFEIQKEALELQQKAIEKQQQIANLLSIGELSPSQAKYLKIKNKLTTEYQKWIIKRKFFGTLMGSLKDIASNAGGWLKTLFKFLFVATLFPKLLPMLINLFINILNFVLKYIIKFIPRMVKMFIKIFTEILPKAVIQIVKTIFPTISIMFRDWGRKMEKEFPALSKISKGLSNIFGKDGFLTKFVLNHIPFIIGLGIASKLLGFRRILSLVSKSITSASKILFKFSRNIIQWFSPKRFSAETGKLVAGQGRKVITKLSGLFLTALMSPIGLIVGAIGLIALKVYETINIWRKNWSKIVKGWKIIKKGVSLVIKQIIKFGKFIWDSTVGNIRKFFEWIYRIFEPAIKVIKKIGDAIKSVIDPIWRTLKKVLEPLFNLLEPVMRGLKSVLMSIWNFMDRTLFAGFRWIKNSISNIIDFFVVFNKLGPFGILNREKREKAFAVQKLIRKSEEAKETGNIRYTRSIVHKAAFDQAAFEQLMREDINKLKNQSSNLERIIRNTEEKNRPRVQTERITRRRKNKSFNKNGR